MSKIRFLDPLPNTSRSLNFCLLKRLTDDFWIRREVGEVARLRMEVLETGRVSAHRRAEC